MNSDADRPLRVLLVEDHQETSGLLRQALERKGHQVTTAASVAETLTVFPAAEPDVLISDIGLPDGNGLDLLGQLHARPSLLAIAMSGYGSQDDRRHSLAAGYHAHLVKPFKCAELHRLLEEQKHQLAMS